MSFKTRVSSILLSLIMLALSTPALLADSYTGQKTLGLQTGYASYNSSALAGIEFTYRFSKHLRLAPSADYVFRNDAKDALCINLNMQVPIALSAAEKFEFFPFAGLNYSSWNYHLDGTANNDTDVTSRITRFGLNAGAGFGMNLSATLRLALTGNYVFIKDFHGCVIMAKIAYRF